MGLYPLHHCRKNRGNGVPQVMPESELVHIRAEVLRRNGVVRPRNRPLNLRPEPFNGIGVNVATDELLPPMVHGLVLIAEFFRLFIYPELVGHNLSADFDIRLDFVEYAVRFTGQRLGFHIPAPFYHTEYRSFAFAAKTTLPISADIGFVYLHNTA